VVYGGGQHGGCSEGSGIETMKILFNNHNDKVYENMLNKLLKEVFFDFQFWYDLNLWDENYESYSILENGEIVSNICVYKTRVLFNAKEYLALSLGAVATKKEYRGRGLARTLMEHIFEKYDGVPMYLSANDGVVNFYPRFGFQRVYDKLPVCEYRVDHHHIPVRKLRYDDPKIMDYVYKRVNFSQKMDCLNTACVNLFYIYKGELKDCIYELPEIDTLVIAKQKGTTLKLIGVFSLREIRFSELVSHLPFCNVDRIQLGFMPYWTDIDFTLLEYQTDPLFAKGISCDLGDFKFPELSLT